MSYRMIHKKSKERVLLRAGVVNQISIKNPTTIKTSNSPNVIGIVVHCVLAEGVSGNKTCIVVSPWSVVADLHNVLSSSNTQ